MSANPGWIEERSLVLIKISKGDKPVGRKLGFPSAGPSISPKMFNGIPLEIIVEELGIPPTATPPRNEVFKQMGLSGSKSKSSYVSSPG